MAGTFSQSLPTIDPPPPPKLKRVRMPCTPQTSSESQLRWQSLTLDPFTCRWCLLHASSYFLNQPMAGWPSCDFLPFSTFSPTGVEAVTLLVFLLPPQARVPNPAVNVDQLCLDVVSSSLPGTDIFLQCNPLVHPSLQSSHRCPFRPTDIVPHAHQRIVTLCTRLPNRA